jgi:hypothetical protein
MPGGERFRNSCDAGPDSGCYLSDKRAGVWQNSRAANPHIDDDKCRNFLTAKRMPASAVKSWLQRIRFRPRCDRGITRPCKCARLNLWRMPILWAATVCLARRLPPMWCSSTNIPAEFRMDELYKERGLRTYSHSRALRAVTGGDADAQLPENWETFWRRERDSNPRRAFDPYTLSRGAPSTTRPSLRAAQSYATGSGRAKTPARFSRGWPRCFRTR